MSWVVFLRDVEPDEILVLSREKYERFKETTPVDEDVIEAMDEQFDAARSAVFAILETNSVGEGRVNVTMSGHTNPDHLPRKGWAPDHVNMQVTKA